MLEKNIYLIGPMGAGKSSVGKQLAALTGARFIDSDEEIQRRTGVSIAWIFEKEKEAGFRKRETEIIAELTQEKNVVLSTGGGSILAKSNQEYLTNTGFIVYLKVSLDIQLERTARRPGARPLLDAPNPKQKLDEINKAREPIYIALANLTVDTDHCSPETVAKKIMKQMEHG